MRISIITAIGILMLMGCSDEIRFDKKSSFTIITNYGACKANEALEREMIKTLCEWDTPLDSCISLEESLQGFWVNVSIIAEFPESVDSLCKEYGFKCRWCNIFIENSEDR